MKMVSDLRVKVTMIINRQPIRLMALVTLLAFSGLAQAALFSIEDLNPNVWFDASASETIEIKDGKVSRWYNKVDSSEFAFAEMEEGTAPTYDGGSISFDGNSNLRWALMGNVVDFTFFVVAQKDDNPASGDFVVLREGGSATGFKIRMLKDTRTDFRVGSSGQTNYDVKIYQPTVMSGAYSNRQTRVSINGDSNVIYNVDAKPQNVYISLGAKIREDEAGFIGKIQEVIYFDYALSHTEQRQVTATLSSKWQQKGDLHDSHPLKNADSAVSDKSYYVIDAQSGKNISLGQAKTLSLDGSPLSNWVLSGANNQLSISATGALTLNDYPRQVTAQVSAQNSQGETSVGTITVDIYQSDSLPKTATHPVGQYSYGNDLALADFIVGKGLTYALDLIPKVNPKLKLGGLLDCSDDDWLWDPTTPNQLACNGTVIPNGSIQNNSTQAILNSYGESITLNSYFDGTKHYYIDGEIARKKRMYLLEDGAHKALIDAWYHTGNEIYADFAFEMLLEWTKQVARYFMVEDNDAPYSTGGLWMKDGVQLEDLSGPPWPAQVALWHERRGRDWFGGFPTELLTLYNGL